MNTSPRIGQYIEVEPGVEIYYEEQGAGSPLVFIPGWTFTTQVFTHQFDHFARTHRVISFDPRSQGRSSKTLHGNDFATHGLDLAKLIDTLGLQDVVLVGWSTGSLTSLSYVRQRGTGALKGLVGIDMSPIPLSVNPQDWVEGPLEEIAGAYSAYLTTPQGQREFIKYYATEVMVQRDLSPEELDWIVAQSLTTPHYLASAIFASAVFANYGPEAQAVSESLPSLYVIAEHWAETATSFMHSRYPAIKTQVLGGHMMFWEHADRFNPILDQFLATL